MSKDEVNGGEFRRVLLHNIGWDKIVSFSNPIVFFLQMIAASVSIYALFVINHGIQAADDNARRVDRSLEFIRMLPENSNDDGNALDLFIRRINEQNDSNRGDANSAASLDEFVVDLHRQIRANFHNGIEDPINFHELQAEIEHRLRLLRTMQACINEYLCDERTIIMMIGNRIFDYYYFLRPLFLCHEPYANMRVNNAIANMTKTFIHHSPEYSEDTHAVHEDCQQYRNHLNSANQQGGRENENAASSSS
jgi:hypothetical protein